MNGVMEGVDRELQEAEARARAAAAPYDAANREYRDLLARADADEAEAAEVESKRDGLLLKAARGDSQAEALLQQLPQHVAALRQHARDLRDAAALLKPNLEALTKDCQQAARVIMELQHRRLIAARDDAAAQYRSALASVWPAAQAYIDAAERAARSHQQIYGELPNDYGYEPPPFKAARFVLVEARKYFGPGQLRTFSIVFPEDASHL